MKPANARVKTAAETMVSEHRPILRTMLAPKSIAVIGASEKPGSVGRALTENLRSFSGSVFAVNPNHATILGKKTLQQSATRLNRSILPSSRRRL